MKVRQFENECGSIKIMSGGKALRAKIDNKLDFFQLIYVNNNLPEPFFNEVSGNQKRKELAPFVLATHGENDFISEHTTQSKKPRFSIIVLFFVHQVEGYL